MGGMGSADTNFYNDAFKRAGYGEEAQIRPFASANEEAAKRVPDAISPIQVLDLGIRQITDRALQNAAGVTTLKLDLMVHHLWFTRFELLEEIIVYDDANLFQLAAQTSH